ncbi:hypothetical protein AVEN_151436-1 [Araneus ventricosus]|uniref:Uncharacterized protein n=1 Tax=Araneus ventricosus TaxID=182803 RepID=A0A4Y2NUG7_ARAVE|nr:hypothetical protein AVEN_151436-1 [Araneus ventricosus]
MDVENVVSNGLQIPCRIVEKHGYNACLFFLFYLVYDVVSPMAKIRTNIVSHVSNNWQRVKCFIQQQSGVPYGSKRQYTSLTYQALNFSLFKNYASITLVQYHTRKEHGTALDLFSKLITK